ncbi:uncharacterized protein CEXT_14121 [Caerostris extrusa]|uniref:Uncharacterized protein n=1 Tax=Caerostris extrusa TaxID=172846 RepID=A0AAV4VNR4_CAEEX|nr:uncharacterized protein CEXT_14121 [Caerostris extrusa]
MFAKFAFFCAALVAVSASGLIAAPLVNTGVSATSSTQDAYGNYAYRYDIQDAATGSINSKAENGKERGAVAVAAPAVAYDLCRPSTSCLCCPSRGCLCCPAVAAYAAPAVAAYAAPAVASYAAPALAARCVATEVLPHQCLLAVWLMEDTPPLWPTEEFSDTEPPSVWGTEPAFTVLVSERPTSKK